MTDPPMPSRGRAFLDILTDLKAARATTDPAERERRVRRAARRAASQPGAQSGIDRLLSDLEEDAATLEPDYDEGLAIMDRARKRRFVTLSHQLLRWEADERAEAEVEAHTLAVGQRQRAAHNLEERLSRARGGEDALVLPAVEDKELGWRLQVIALPAPDKRFSVQAKLSDTTTKPFRPFPREWKAEFALDGEPQGLRKLPGAWQMERLVSFDELAKVTIAVTVA